jgi:hypothetical protein
MKRRFGQFADTGSTWTISRQTGRLPPRTHPKVCLTPVSCCHQTTAKRIPLEVLEYLRKFGKAYGSQGGEEHDGCGAIGAREEGFFCYGTERTATRERAERAKKSVKH